MNRLNQFLLLIILTLIPSVLICQSIPVLTIFANQEIPDEPKVPATLAYIDNDGEEVTKYIGIEVRGGFSQTYPKKTFDIEFWTDGIGSDTEDVQFGSLRSDDDWVLDALYNEPLRINSYLSHKLWLQMQSPYYQSDEPNAKSGADVMFVTVNLNGVYQGIYLLSEQIDRSLLKLKKPNDDGIRGELYKGVDHDDAVYFNDPQSLPDNASDLWSGFEYKYPSDEIDWTNLADLVDFVANSDDDTFRTEVSERFDIENAINYFILINLTRALDNRGKNIYLCRYDKDEKYFLTPWDLDGSWGAIWNGDLNSQYTDILSSNLFDRLIATNVDDYRQKLSDKWFELRGNILSDQQLQDNINEAHQYLSSNDIYTKEEEAWDYESTDSHLTFTLTWINNRLGYLDDYFDDITSTSNLDIIDIGIFPNPAQDLVYIISENQIGETANIYSSQGQLMKSEQIMSNRFEMSVAELNPGIYFVLVNGTRAGLFISE